VIDFEYKFHGKNPVPKVKLARWSKLTDKMQMGRMNGKFEFPPICNIESSLTSKKNAPCVVAPMLHQYDKELLAHCFPECPQVQRIFIDQYFRIIIKHVCLHGDHGGHT
jgi:hypothetical protein